MKPMIKNKHSARSLIAFLVTWSFLVLTVTGLVLYIVPQGRVAYWVHWSLLGLEKTQWGWVHIMFGGIFIATGVLHLYFNWKPFKNYLADRVRGHLAIKRELVISLALTVVVIGLSIADLPPASWVISLNEAVKDSWITSPELEPPFGHAEEASLAGIARRMDLDLQAGLTALRGKGIRFDSERDSLERIARLNDTTPMAIYELFRQFEKTGAADPPPVTPEEVEARYGGTGLGRKGLGEIADKVGLDIDVALQRLKEAGIEASKEDNARELAERHELSPVDLLKVMMVPGFRPAK